jgi:hypothetical protein
VFLFCGQGIAADVAHTKKFGEWTSMVASDAMTDEKRCYAVYARDPNVVYTQKDAIKVSFKGRGGVAGYQYRFGKAQASEVQTPDASDNDWVSIPVFVAEALEQPYARVSGTTILKAQISMEISFVGLKAARADMAARCDMSALPSAGEAPEWARWQVLPKQ